MSINVCISTWDFVGKTYKRNYDQKLGNTVSFYI